MHCLIESSICERINSIKLVGLKVKSSSKSHKSTEGLHSKSGGKVVGKDRVLLQVTMYTKVSFEFGEETTCVKFVGKSPHEW